MSALRIGNKVTLVLCIFAVVPAQYVVVEVPPFSFEYWEREDRDLRGDPSRRLILAATSWCEDKSAVLAVPLEDCKKQVVQLTMVEIIKMRGAMHPWSEDEDNEHGDQDDSQCVISKARVQFNCMVVISFEDSMSIVGYIDFLEGDTPENATERMRLELNERYNETILDRGRLAELVGDTVAVAAKLCPPKIPGEKRKCKLTQARREGIKCYKGKRSELLDKGYWLELGKKFGLTITESIPASKRVTLSDERMEQIRDDLQLKGYTKIPRNELRLNEMQPLNRIERLRGMVEKLHDMKLPAGMVLLYDEAWQLFHPTMHGFMEPLIGGPVTVRGVGATMWAITQHPHATREKDLYTSNVGHAPHRDGGGPEPPSRQQLGDIQAWLPLTDHVPPQAAIYMLPKHLDRLLQFPGAPSVLKKYSEPKPQQYLDAFYHKQISFDLQSVRAVPAKAGDLILWDGRVMHWASSSDDGPLQSRLAGGFYCPEVYNNISGKNMSVEANIVMRKWPEFRWNSRLALVCGQLFTHARLYPAFVDFVRKHFRFCPHREAQSKYVMWDPDNFPLMKERFEYQKKWLG